MAVIYDTSSESTNHNRALNASDMYGAGAYVNSTDSSMYNQVPQKVTVNIAKSGSPSGDVICQIVNASGTVKQNIGTVDVSTLGSSQDVVFENTSATYAMQTTDSLMIYFNGGNGANGIYVSTSSSNVADADDTKYAYWTTSNSIVPVTDQDIIVMKVETGSSSGGGSGGSADDANATGMYEPPIQIFRRMNF